MEKENQFYEEVQKKSVEELSPVKLGSEDDARMIQ